jgi:hypothetical protein
MTEFPSSQCVILDPIINLQKDEVFRYHMIPLPGLDWLTKNATEPEVARMFVSEHTYRPALAFDSPALDEAARDCKR